jgi:hypothetical protein
LIVGRSPRFPQRLAFVLVSEQTPPAKFRQDHLDELFSAARQSQASLSNHSCIVWAMSAAIPTLALPVMPGRKYICRIVGFSRSPPGPGAAGRGCRTQDALGAE